MDRERIDDIICDIMVNDGPDRHVDGHDVITSFVMALLNDNGEVWAANYANVVANRKRRLMGSNCPRFHFTTPDPKG